MHRAPTIQTTRGPIAHGHQGSPAAELIPSEVTPLANLRIVVARADAFATEAIPAIPIVCPKESLNGFLVPGWTHTSNAKARSGKREAGSGKQDLINYWEERSKKR